MKRFAAMLCAAALLPLSAMPVSAAETSPISHPYDINRDGHINAVDLTLAKRTALEEGSAGLADAIRDYLMMNEYDPEMLYPVVEPAYNFDANDVGTYNLPLETSVDYMDVVETKSQLKPLAEQGRQYAIYPSPDALDDSVAFLAVTVEQSPDTKLMLSHVTRYEGQYLVTMVRQNTDVTEIQPTKFTIHLRIAKEDYHGEPVILSIADLGEQFSYVSIAAGTMNAENSSSSDKIYTNGTLDVADVRDLVSRMDTCTPPVRRLAQRAKPFTDAQGLLIAMIRNSDAGYAYHTRGMTLDEDGVLHWQIDEVIPLMRDNNWAHYDVIAAGVPTEYIGKEIVVEITEVRLFP